MIDLRSQVCKDGGQYLSAFKHKEAIAMAASLLTLPRLSANSIRCETLVHLAVAYSRGSKQPNRTTFNTTLNDLFVNTQIAMVEDPQEDVYVSNILTEHGNLRLFNGLWEGNDYYIQVLIDIVTRYQVPDSLQQIRESCISLLKLSEEVASRSGLNRNTYEDSFDKAIISVPKSNEYSSISKRVIFTSDELDSLGVTVESIEPFVISYADMSSLKYSTVGNSILEKKPIVKFDGSYILSMPNAVGIAIRYYFLTSCKENSSLEVFSRLLAKYQAEQLTGEILREFRGRFESVDPGISVIENTPSMHALLLRDNSGNYFHAVILHDEIHQITDEGIGSCHTLSELQVDALDKFFNEVAEYCKSQDDFVSGLSLITHGGLGRGFNFGFKKWPDEWGFSVISLNDLLLLSNSKSKPLEEILQCLRQKKWMEDQGVKLNNINGDFNYFGFWKENDYRCVPDQIPVSENGFIALYTDFVFSLRKDLRIEIDKHCAKYIDGTWKRVERLTKDSFYMGMKNKPIYASVDHLDSGILNGLVESEFIELWFGADFVNETTDSSVIYEWWSAFINAIDEALNYISSFISFEACYTLQIVIDFSDISLKEQIDLELLDKRGVDIIWAADICRIKLESNFMANFAQVDNTGEKLILNLILSSMADYLNRKGLNIDKHVNNAIEHVLGDSAVRLVHVFRSYNPADILLHKVPSKLKFVDIKKTTFDRIRISKSLKLSNQEIEGKHNCVDILNKIVNEIWAMIKAILSTINRRSILNELVLLVNSIEQDRGQWNRTARALFAIHSKHDDVIRVAQNRESNRSLTSLCLRSLVEMSLSECPDNSGIPANDCIIDDLLSLTSLLVNTASDSDAIHWGLVDPKLIINMNGTFFIPIDVMEDMLLPYFSDHFVVQFSGAIDDYEELYNTKIVENYESKDGVYGKEFDKALIAEYGLSTHYIVECCAEIIDLHVETSQPVIIMDLEELICRIVNKRNIHVDIVEMFFQAFTSYSRNKWDKPPEGFLFRDIAPWKYKRKLSCLVKPILQINDNEFFLSLSLFRLGIAYFLDRAQDGLFNTKFFNSPTMRSYIGSIAEKKGSDFTDLVGSKLEDNGWYVRKEVLMTELGATKELGDIDVLAIKDGVMLIFECKKLQMAKTISEISDVCNRFRGSEKDELRKHLNRVDWSTKNLDIILRGLKYKDGVSSIRNALLTSVTMPMKYKKDLPIACEDIISLREFDFWISTVNFHPNII